MSKGLEILIHKGIGNITFGMSKNEVIALMGEPTEEEILDVDDDTSSSVYLYDNELLIFFFENDKLSCIEVNNEEATLFGEKVFELSEKEIVALMVKNNFTKQDMETEAWGEKTISFEEASVDFFFDGEDLVSFSFGKA